MINYKIYPSLLDAFGNYLNSSQIYNQFYGFSENPKISEEEFEKEQFNRLMNSINRIPIPWEDTEAMDKGTAFNEVIDCMIDNKKSDKMEIKKVFEKSTQQANKVTAIKATYNGRTFEFPIAICKEFAEYFKGAITQQFCEAELPTKYGNILLYGYIDEILPFKIADIKTTKNYKSFKYKNNWQKVVYPYCLMKQGTFIKDFEFVVTDFKNSWIEPYIFAPEKDVPKLIEHCEMFIEFLENYKHLITNKKIFAM